MPHRHFDEEDRCQWMQQLPDEVRRRPLHSVLLPTTHDSAAYQLAQGRLAQSKKSWAYWAERFSRLPVVNRFQRAWTLTQNASLFQQLVMGVRAFDLRLAYDERNHRFYFAHRFACTTAAFGIKEVKHFLDLYRGEVVLLFIKPDWENRAVLTAERATDFLGEATRILGDHLLPPTADNVLTDAHTIDALAASGKRCVLYFSGKGGGTFVWKRSNITGAGFTADLDARVENLTAHLQRIKGQPTRNLHAISLTLTPDTDLIVGALKRKLTCRGSEINSTEELTALIHALRFELLEEWVQRDLLDSLSLLATDFVDIDFIDWVLNYNLDFRNGPV